MKLKKVEIALMIGLAAALLCGAATARAQTALSQKLIRLHVVANSDSAEDQALKLLVRDDILDETNKILCDSQSVTDARAALAAHLSQLQARAQARLDAEGVCQRVSVSLQSEDFPRRDYDSFSLPAGRYLSLRVTIGAGEGHNWWCVVFPSLCMSAASEDFYAAASSAGLSDSEVALITRTDGYVLKFKAAEWVQRLRQWLTG